MKRHKHIMWQHFLLETLLFAINRSANEFRSMAKRAIEFIVSIIYLLSFFSFIFRFLFWLLLFCFSINHLQIDLSRTVHFRLLSSVTLGSLSTSSLLFMIYDMYPLHHVSFVEITSISRSFCVVLNNHYLSKYLFKYLKFLNIDVLMLSFLA